MTYSCVDFVDSILNALGIKVPQEHWDNPEGQANLAITEIERLQAVDKAHKARPATSMERMLYYVGPIGDQCPWDEDGQVSRDLFVWATDASEAVKLWREYYELSDEPESEEASIGITDKVRVFEVPIMPNAATSTAINWGDIHIYGATITERVEL